jgi:hypothetical protein
VGKGRSWGAAALRLALRSTSPAKSGPAPRQAPTALKERNTNDLNSPYGLRSLSPGIHPRAAGSPPGGDLFPGDGFTPGR